MRKKIKNRVWNLEASIAAPVTPVMLVEEKKRKDLIISFSSFELQNF